MLDRHDRPDGGRWPRLSAAAGALVLAAVLAACGRGSAAPRTDGTAHGGVGTRTATGPATSAPAPTTTTTTTTTVPPEPGWTVLASETTGVAVDERAEPQPDGSTVTVIRFRAGQVHFDLHVGSQDPPTGSAVIGPNAGSAIGPTEAPVLLAAFNGGFKVTTGAGGMELDGQVLTPLESGDASLVISSTGAATIGVWGDPGFPPAGTTVASVRQNLPPLVQGGQPAGDAGTWRAWGATVTGISDVARSALGVDAGGDLLYAASMNTLPVDLADALVAAGAETAMELDINPDWVQADVAPAPGAPLSAAVPGQYPSATQYQSGWTRDFVAVLAGGPAAG